MRRSVPNDPLLAWWTRVHRRKVWGPERRPFGPELAGNCRFKHPRSWTKEEREWASLDKILNPELWHGLKLRSMKDQSQETADQLQSYLKPADCIKETVDPEDVPPPSVAKKKVHVWKGGQPVWSSCQ